MFQTILFMAATLTSSTSPEAQINKTLDGFHKAASEAKFEDYFSYFAKDGVFIGTDASERWTVDEFKAYAKPHFAKGKGWTYTPKSRNIGFSPDQKTAWFDEILSNEKYGVSRGSGVLVLDKAEWRLAQYHLTFPIPNDLADRVTKEIRAYEKSKSLPRENR